jgi:hypothetical protein
MGARPGGTPRGNALLIVDCVTSLGGGLEALGLQLVAPAEHRLPQLTTVRIPEGIDDLEVRRTLLKRHGIEIGGGLGPFAGSVWRIGCMAMCSFPSEQRALGLLPSSTQLSPRPSWVPGCDTLEPDDFVEELGERDNTPVSPPWETASPGQVTSSRSSRGPVSQGDRP